MHIVIGTSFHVALEAHSAEGTTCTSVSLEGAGGRWVWVQYFPKYNGAYVNGGLKQTGADIISLHCNDVI